MTLLAVLLLLLTCINECRACSVCHAAHPLSFGMLSSRMSRRPSFAEALPALERRMPLGKAQLAKSSRFVSSDEEDETESDLSTPPNDDQTRIPEEALNGEQHQDEESPIMSSAMIATIGVYKEFISPLLPPACRFLPTCSQYGVQAIQEFGPCKGSLLTTWRLLRCSPIGGKGYDPPKWPPVAYWYSSY